MKANMRLMKHVKRFLLIMMIVCVNIKYCYPEQKDTICYEKKALAFYKDSIIPKLYKYKKTKIIFNGYVDSSITLIVYSCFIKYPITDSSLKKVCENYEKELVHEKKNPIFITTKRVFFSKKNICVFKKKRFLKVFQALKIENSVYVWIQTYSNNVKKVLSDTQSFFIKMNLKGDIVDWCSGFH